MKKRLFSIFGLLTLLIIITSPWWYLVLIDKFVLQPKIAILNHPVETRNLNDFEVNSFWEVHKTQSYSYQLPNTYQLVNTQVDSALVTDTYKDTNEDTILVSQLDYGFFSDSTGATCPNILSSVFSHTYKDFTPWTLNPFYMLELSKKLILKSVSFPVNPGVKVYNYTGNDNILVFEKRDSNNQTVFYIEKNDCQFGFNIIIDSEFSFDDIDRIVSSINASP